MRKCPRCGKYMENYLKQFFGGARLVYVCRCGYSAENENNDVYWDSVTIKKQMENNYDNA